MKGTQRYYINPDHVGAPRTILNQNGQIVWQWDRDAFGTGNPNQKPGSAASFAYNLRLPGQYHDKETGLYFNNARYYDPALGRYIESDPIGLAAGPNPYIYVGANPVNAVDPWGLYSFEDLNSDLGNFLISNGLGDITIKTGNATAGWADVLSFGATSWLRKKADLNDFVDECSPEYKAGEWAGIGLSLLESGYGLARGGLRLELGNWKVAGKWFFPQGTKGPHFHWGSGLGLQTHHLPWQVASWMENMKSLVRRGRAADDLVNIGLVTHGASVPSTVLQKPGLGD
jgi:RHS repeat-associated protein